MNTPVEQLVEQVACDYMGGRCNAELLDRAIDCIVYMYGTAKGTGQ